jgi:hypothetical protein
VRRDSSSVSSIDVVVAGIAPVVHGAFARIEMGVHPPTRPFDIIHARVIAVHDAARAVTAPTRRRGRRRRRLTTRVWQQRRPFARHRRCLSRRRESF